LEPRTITGLTTAAHFAYGSAAGVPYTLLVERLPASTPVKGATYGLFVWAASYLLLLPGLNILYPATDHPRRRNLLMIVAHLVWGVALAAASRAMSGPRSTRPQDRTTTLPAQGAGGQSGLSSPGRRGRGR